MRTMFRLLAVAAWLTMPLGVVAQDDAPATWTPELQMQYKRVGQVAISPDGARVAYVVTEPIMEGEKSEYLGQIWLAGADGSGAFQFTRGEKSSGSPAFSPDGRYLAFSSARSGKNQVWVMPLAGGEAWQVTDEKDGVGGFQWSPDGTRMAFTMSDRDSEEDEKAKKEKYYVIRVDQDFKYRHLYVVDVGDGTGDPAESTRLTAGDFHVTGMDWSPDGTRIAYSYQADPRINTGRLSGDLAVVTVDGGEVTQIVTTPGVESQPWWSPDGRWIAYVSTGDQPEPIGMGDAYLTTADGSESRRLALTPDRSPGVLGWTDDSKALLLTEAIGTERHLIRLPADGSAAEVLTQQDGVYGSFAFSDGEASMAFTYQEPDLPADVYVSGTDGTHTTRVSDIHAGVARPEMGKTELLSWTSPDGTEIEGLLTYPVGYEAGRSVPLILNVHGGPAGVFSQSFTGGPSIYMLQTWAQDGFAVLRPNPRGSSGYGKEFRYANFRDWGYGDLDDLLAGVDLTVDMGVAHPDSLLLMGWSYGGYMTSFAVTRTNRFKAASMGAGLPNLISMTTTTDIQDYLVGHMGAEFWEDFETYEKHSAIYQIGNIETPMQVIHGQNDLRVPFTQGQEFYRALDRKGVPTEMIVLPRTPHGPREPKLLMSVQPLIMEWFKTHLRPTRITSDWQ
jgi:dipeptidyl aminopeptidase/acylaminoacyl peptidase